MAGRPEGGSWPWGVGADGCPAKDTWTSTPLGPGEATLFGRRVFANVTTLSSETSVLKRERQREIRHRAEGHGKTEAETRARGHRPRDAGGQRGPEDALPEPEEVVWLCWRLDVDPGI